MVVLALFASAAFYHRNLISDFSQLGSTNFACLPSWQSDFFSDSLSFFTSLFCYFFSRTSVPTKSIFYFLLGKINSLLDKFTLNWRQHTVFSWFWQTSTLFFAVNSCMCVRYFVQQTHKTNCTQHYFACNLAGYKFWHAKTFLLFKKFCETT